MIFPQIENAATAAAILRDQPVAAVELMDRASLRSVENKLGMPHYLKTLADQTAALLVETRAYTAEELQGQVRTVTDSLKRVPFERPFASPTGSRSTPPCGTSAKGFSRRWAPCAKPAPR